MARVPGTDDARLTAPVADGAERSPERLRPGARRSLVATTVALTLALAGCGSASIHDLPPAAEPAISPAQATTPPGAIWNVGGDPEGVVIDPANHVAAVALRAPNVLRIVDLATRRTLRDVPLPGEARHLTLQSSLSGTGGVTLDGAAAGATGIRVLVPVESAGRLLSIALPSGRIVADVAVGDHPHDVTALSPTTEVVGNERGNTITLVDGQRVVRSQAVATQPGGLSSLRDGALVAVVSVRERKLELYDGRTLKRVASEPAGVGPTHVACAPQGPCFVVDTDGDALLVFRVGPGGHDLRLTRRVYLGPSPYGLALDPTHSRTRLWITNTGDNQLLELAAQGRPHVLSRTPLVRQANSVAVDQATGDVLVAGATRAGELQLLPDPASPNR